MTEANWRELCTRLRALVSPNCLSFGSWDFYSKCYFLRWRTWICSNIYFRICHIFLTFYVKNDHGVELSGQTVTELSKGNCPGHLLKVVRKNLFKTIAIEVKIRGERLNSSPQETKAEGCLNSGQTSEKHWSLGEGWPMWLSFHYLQTGVYQSEASTPPQRLEDRDLIFLVITFQMVGSQVLGEDIPALWNIYISKGQRKDLQLKVFKCSKKGEVRSL